MSKARVLIIYKCSECPYVHGGYNYTCSQTGQYLGDSMRELRRDPVPNNCRLKEMPNEKIL